jgi:hypothetical protein
VAVVLSLCFLSSTVAATGTVELHAASFHALITDEADRDALIVFYEDSSSCESSKDCSSALRVADDIAATVGSSILVALYDTAAHGIPAGVHIHGSPAVLLVAAGDRGSFEFDWSSENTSDERSRIAPGGAAQHVHSQSCRHDDENHDSHDHEGHNNHGTKDSRPLLQTAVVLEWLREHTTFPSDVPSPTLADRWRGREEGVIRAMSEGLEALRQLVLEVRAENKALRSEVKGLRSDNAALRRRLQQHDH